MTAINGLLRVLKGTEMAYANALETGGYLETVAMKARLQAACEAIAVAYDAQAARIAELETQRDNLLMACEAARSVIGDGSRFLSNKEMLALDLLDTVIAKAQGETTK